MQNHGLVTVGKHIEHAIQNAAFFELACEVILKCGDRLVPLTASAVADLISARSG